MINKPRLQCQYALWVSCAVLAPCVCSAAAHGLYRHHTICLYIFVCYSTTILHWLIFFLFNMFDTLRLLWHAVRARTRDAIRAVCVGSCCATTCCRASHKEPNNTYGFWMAILVMPETPSLPHRYRVVWDWHLCWPILWHYSTERLLWCCWPPTSNLVYGWIWCAVLWMQSNTDTNKNARVCVFFYFAVRFLNPRIYLHIYTDAIATPH